MSKVYPSESEYRQMRWMSRLMFVGFGLAAVAMWSIGDRIPFEQWLAIPTAVLALMNLRMSFVRRPLDNP